MCLCAHLPPCTPPQVDKFAIWNTTTSQTCDQTKDQLYFFFTWNQPLAPDAMATQPNYTTVKYTATTAVITMPIQTAKLPWTNNQPWDSLALCCHIKPLYMVTGVFSNVSVTHTHTQAHPPLCCDHAAAVAGNLSYTRLIIQTCLNDLGLSPALLNAPQLSLRESGLKNAAHALWWRETTHQSLLSPLGEVAPDHG